MKHFLPVAWWLAATVVIALVLVSLGYPFTDALLLGAMFLRPRNNGFRLSVFLPVRGRMDYLCCRE